MHKAVNVLVWLGAAAVCALMTYLSLGAGFATVAFNVTVLLVMIVIILFSWIFAFHRLSQTAKGMNKASGKLVNIYKNRAGIADITKSGAQLFEVSYFDEKYQEYLGYLRKTNSPTDIGEYIGEYEINNYTHRHLAESVPDILTSLGILGTFVGLVWGLKGFNPVSYEAMASSITSLIDGIKVAFITSIYGIVLSLAYNFVLRGSLTKVSEALDNFLDKYYLCAVSPTDATAMNHVLANQKEQTKAIQTMSSDLVEGVSGTMKDGLQPVVQEMHDSIEHFTNVVTMNQQDLLEHVAEQVSTSIRKEFFSEFSEMRDLLRQTNQVQKDYLNYVSKTTETFEKSLNAGLHGLTDASTNAMEQLTSAANVVASQQSETYRQVQSEQKEAYRQLQSEQQEAYRQLSSQQNEAMKQLQQQEKSALAQLTAQQDILTKQVQTQQEHLSEFVTYMTQVMDRMSQINTENARAGQLVTKQIESITRLGEATADKIGEVRKQADRAEMAARRAEAPVQKTEITNTISDLDELTERLDQVIDLMERQARQSRDTQNSKKKKGLFN